MKSKDQDLVGRMFTAKMIELAFSQLSRIFYWGRSKVWGPVLVYWPALIDSKHIKETVHINGKEIDVMPTNQLNFDETYYQKQPIEIPSPPSKKLLTKPPRRAFGARSEDLKAVVQISVYGQKMKMHFSFLNKYLTVEKIKELMPDISEFEIDRYELPNILSLNFYIHDILEDGVSSNTRKDGQAKSLGEYLRAKYADIPNLYLRKTYEHR